ncbi:MAG: hypothetical protein QOK21_899 [Solirubrobacteraceae bacterium]|jgi:hypothetical protein|nr:hypothetical protein [Solirubrobacteraceae bacterium]
MLTLIGLSQAWKMTLGLVVVFFVAFPILVQGLIMFAASVARGEHEANERRKNRRR